MEEIAQNTFTVSSYSNPIEIRNEITHDIKVEPELVTKLDLEEAKV